MGARITFTIVQEHGARGLPTQCVLACSAAVGRLRDATWEAILGMGNRVSWCQQSGNNLRTNACRSADFSDRLTRPGTVELRWSGRKLGRELGSPGAR
jgi:hypothetical protein